MILIVVFVYVDRRVAVKVLPPSMFGPGPLKWIYLALAVLMISAMVDMYVPLFGQRLAHLAPVVAGFLGAALAIGWAVSELLSASLKSSRIINRVVDGRAAGNSGRSGPDRSQPVENDGGPRRHVGAGADDHRSGIGAGSPHLSAWAMQCVDENEGAAAGAAITRWK